MSVRCYRLNKTACMMLAALTDEWQVAQAIGEQLNYDVNYIRTVGAFLVRAKLAESSKRGYRRTESMDFLALKRAVIITIDQALWPESVVAQRKSMAGQARTIPDLVASITISDSYSGHEGVQPEILTQLLHALLP